MIPPITPITQIAAANPLSATASAPATGTSAAGGSSFQNLLGNAIDQLQGVTQNASTLSLEGATGQANVADVTVASTEAQLALSLATTTRDKAVDAFNSIMSMTT
ncbi:MAG: Flagellar hook-basal body complex protein FliE [Acidimicrobiaceae bacterium]|nr:Flagellar hook-basal body complex protein FliE [Acidimicrobiaceae bacterium]